MRISELRYRQPPPLFLSLSLSFSAERHLRGPSINEHVTCHFTNAPFERNIPCLLKRIDPSVRAMSSGRFHASRLAVLSLANLSLFSPFSALFPNAINVRVTSVPRLRRRECALATSLSYRCDRDANFQSRHWPIYPAIGEGTGRARFDSRASLGKRKMKRPPNQRQFKNPRHVASVIPVSEGARRKEKGRADGEGKRKRDR